MTEHQMQKWNYGDASRLVQQGYGPPAEYAPVQSEDGHNLWALLNDRLAGRWRFALPLALILGAACATVGYFIPNTSYDSTGLIRVAPKITPIMREIAETGMMPLYANFVQTQARLITSERVISWAIQNRIDLKDTPWMDTREAMLVIQSNLSARADRNSQLILVSFRAENPAVAQLVVNAVIDAYHELYGSADSVDLRDRLQRLRTLRDQRRTQLRQKQNQLQDVVSGSQFVVSDLTPMIQQANLRIQQYESDLRRIQYELAALGYEESDEPALAMNGEPSESTEGEAAAEQRQIAERELTSFDAELARLANRRENARYQYSAAQDRFRPDHPAYQRAEAELRLAERQFDKRRLVVLEQYLEASPTAIEAIDPVAAKRRQVQMLQTEIGHQRSIVREMNRTQTTITGLKQEIEDLEQELAEATTRIRDLEVESDAISEGRISIASYGNRPLRPNNDRRRALAVIGALGGFGAGIGTFFLLGTIDRRAYAVQQIQSSTSGITMLGVLPALPRYRTNPEAAGVAAHCVHQIRNHIEVVRQSREAEVIAVSSPYQGDGKTSLALALGASYAASGYRTLLIDCDLVGQSLSSQMGLSGTPGIREAIRQRDAFGHITEIEGKKLSVLSSGIDNRFGPEMITRSDLEWLFAEYRAKFDIVLVDTGPLLGSVESLPIAAAADSVILTMWRGRRRGRLEDCIKLLRSVGAHCLGLVLNYAKTSDCDYYVSTSKVSADAGVESAMNGAATNGAARKSRERHNVLLDALMKPSAKDDAA